MSDKEMNAEEILKYLYELALDEENDPAMVKAMMGALALGTVKLVHGSSGPCFSTTAEGLRRAEALMKTPEGREVVAKFKRLQIQKT